MKTKNKTIKSFSTSTKVLIFIVVYSAIALFSLFTTNKIVYAENVSITNISILASAADDPACVDSDPKTECKIVADCNTGSTPDENLNPNNCGITSMIAKLTNILSAIVGIIVIIVIIIGGIQYSASSGDPNAAAAAKKRISNAVIALLAFAMTYGFLQWIIPGGLF